jgi:hypothetical protein
LVAQRRAWPAAEHRAHPSAEVIELRPPYRVHATMDAVQASDRYPVLDFGRAEAKAHELPPVHDPVLSAGKTPSLLRFGRHGHQKAAGNGN